MKDKMELVYVAPFSAEPILRRAPNGELLCLSMVGGVTEPAVENRCAVFRSGDNGATWSMPQLIDTGYEESTMDSEMAVFGDTIRAYLSVHDGHHLNWRAFVMESRDNGHTWTNAGPAPFLPDYTYLRGVLRLRDGRLLQTYQHYPITPEDAAALMARHGWLTEGSFDVVENGVLESCDNGKTWKRFFACNLNFREKGLKYPWSEPTLAELSDGRIVMLMRFCLTGRLWRSESRDGGHTWTEAVPTHIPNPSNKPKLIALPDGRIALLHTPSANIEPFSLKTSKARAFPHAARRPLAIWISDDDMQTWGVRHIVTNFPGAFNYCDGFAEVQADGQIHILFTVEYNRHDILFVDSTID